MRQWPEDFLQKTVEVWQPTSEAALTLDDAREIAENTVGFYATLIRWGQEAEAARTTNKKCL